jgi:hypothetical protein
MAVATPAARDGMLDPVAGAEAETMPLSELSQPLSLFHTVCSEHGTWG